MDNVELTAEEALALAGDVIHPEPQISEEALLAFSEAMQG